MNRRNFLMSLGCMALVPFVPKVKASLISPTYDQITRTFARIHYASKHYLWNFDPECGGWVISEQIKSQIMEIVESPGRSFELTKP